MLIEKSHYSAYHMEIYNYIYLSPGPKIFCHVDEFLSKNRFLEIFVLHPCKVCCESPSFLMELCLTAEYSVPYVLNMKMVSLHLTFNFLFYSTNLFFL
uniref:Uncharacterized protein n=1 Tax=Cryptosporidium parvum TaxID=5807 RepID=F0X5I6_CRYPV